MFSVGLVDGDGSREKCDRSRGSREEWFKGEFGASLAYLCLSFLFCFFWITWLVSLRRRGE